MQTYYAQRDYEKAAELLAAIPSDSSQRPYADLVHGRCMQRLAEGTIESNKTERLQMAMDDFQRVLASAKTSVTIRRRGNLELGRVIRNLGKTTQAVSTFSALRLSSPFEPESLVSGLEEKIGRAHV